jgi:hypothetical protein
MGEMASFTGSGADAAALSGVGSAATGILGGVAQSKALAAQGAYQSGQLQVNAELAHMQADQAIKIGEKKATQIGIKRNRIIGAQRAAGAAGNVVVDEGTNAELQKDTSQLAAKDILEVRNNAWREAWGYNFQAQQYQGASRLTQLSAANASSNALASGIIQGSSSLLTASHDFYGSDTYKSWFGSSGSDRGGSLQASPFE